MRHTLTDEQFIAYIDVERKAQVEERVVRALGGQAAFADVLAGFFGAKGTKPGAMNAFIQQIGGEGAATAAVGDSKDMSKLRNRIKSLVQEGELK